MPIEYEIDKGLGMSGRDAVKEIGIEQYNAKCREIVMRHSSEWRRVIERLGRWIDFDNDYKVWLVHHIVVLMLNSRPSLWIHPSWSLAGGYLSSSLTKVKSIAHIRLCRFPLPCARRSVIWNRSRTRD